MSRHVAVLEKPVVVLLLVWMFASNALPQPIQNFTVKLAIDALMGFHHGEGIPWMIPWMSKKEKNDQHGLRHVICKENLLDHSNIAS